MEGIGDGSDGMGFDMPMLMNQQPQFFGAYGQDGSPVPSVLPGQTFQDEQSMGVGDDQNDAKRRRIARVRGFSFSLQKLRFGHGGGADVW